MKKLKDANSGILNQIRRELPYLNPALRRIAEQVLVAPNEVKMISIKALAARCDVSESTVTRFVREIEVPSFQQLKVLIAEDLSQANPNATPLMADKHVYEDVTDADDAYSIMRKVAARYAATVQDNFETINLGELEKAVSAIEQCDTMAFFAMGSSILCVENAILRFQRVGKRCQFFRDLGIRQNSTATLDENCLAVGISNSGRSISTVDALRAAKAQRAATLCITSFGDAPLVQHADIKLFTNTRTGATGSAEYHESMVSKIAQLHLIDVLYSCYAVRNFGTAIEALEITDSVAASTRY